MNRTGVHLIAYKSLPAQCWMVKHLNDPDTVAIMGTTDVASAFTPQAPAAYVKEELQRLNPDCTLSTLENPGCFWKIAEPAEQHITTDVGWMLRQFLLSLNNPHDGLNLKRLFTACTPTHRELLLECLHRYATNPTDPELQACARWMCSLQV